MAECSVYQCRYCFIVNTFNAQPRPRVLFEDVPRDELAELVQLVPSIKRIHKAEDVHESEYDMSPEPTAPLGRDTGVWSFPLRGDVSDHLEKNFGSNQKDS